MGEKLYGVDMSGEITPLMVRDAIVACFRDAHKQAIAALSREDAFSSESEKLGIEKIRIDLIVRAAFEDANADFENPTKEELVRVVGELAKFSERFRKPEIIRKHYREIMRLVDMCRD